MAPSRCATSMTWSVGTNRNSASLSTNFLISQGQATRSTPTCSQLIHFMTHILLLHSRVAPARVYPTPSESGLALALAGTCGKVRPGQRRPAPTRSESLDRRHPHGPETAAPARPPAHVRASALPTGRLLPRVRQSPPLTIETARGSREWRAAPRRHRGAAAPPDA